MDDGCHHEPHTPGTPRGVKGGTPPSLVPSCGTPMARYTSNRGDAAQIHLGRVRTPTSCGDRSSAAYAWLGGDSSGWIGVPILQPVSYDFALISESYSTNKHHRVCYDNSPPSSSSISSRQYRSSSVCTSAMAAWQVAGVTLLKPSATCARSPFVV